MSHLFAVLLGLGILVSAPASPAAAASRDCDKWSWSFSLDLAPGHWSVGEHVYQIHSWLSDGTSGTFTVAFSVDPSAPLQHGEVLLLLLGPLGRDGRTFTIHPDQDTAFQVGFVHGGRISSVGHAEAERVADLTGAEFRWDDRSEWVSVPRSPVVALCGSLSNPARFLRDWNPDFVATE